MQFTAFTPGDFVAPREGGRLGVVTRTVPHLNIFWTVWENDLEWSHPEPHNALRPADIPPPTHLLGSILRHCRVIAQNPDIFPRSQPLIDALRRGIQWHEHRPIPSVRPNGGAHGR